MGAATGREACDKNYHHPAYRKPVCQPGCTGEKKAKADDFCGQTSSSEPRHHILTLFQMCE